MKNTVLDLGGELQRGDLVAISEGTNLDLAWYVNATPKGMKVIILHTPSMIKTQFDTYIQGKNSYLDKRFNKGFSFETIIQTLVYNSYCRAIKIDNIRATLHNPSLIQRYEDSKKILLDFNFPAK